MLTNYEYIDLHHTRGSSTQVPWTTHNQSQQYTTPSRLVI